MSEDVGTAGERVLSVMMPVYNEVATVREIINRVLEQPWVGQLVIVDDCSSDGTAQLLRREVEGSDPRITVVYHEQNQGKGAAIRTARDRVSHPYVTIQDADLEYDPREYGRLLAPLLEGHADVVYGSRFRGEVRRVLFFWHAVGNHLITLLSNAFTNLNLTDVETCYKVFRSEVFRSLKLRSNRFGFEPEVTAKVARLGLRVYEVPISYHGRTYLEGKKIGWKDGFNALWVIFREGLFGARQDLDDVHLSLWRLSSLRRYSAFLWSQVDEHAGQRVVEAGAGIGNMTPFLLGREKVWITDVDDTFLRHLRGRYGHRPNVEVVRLDLTQPIGDGNGPDLAGAADSVVAFNVIEHLRDDVASMRHLRDLLAEDGRALIVVPAGPGLYGALDEALGHERRYRKAELVEKLERAGFVVESIHHANAIGALGWWLNGRLLRRRRLPGLQARMNALLVPWLRLECALGVPFGLSLVAVARRG